MTSIRLNYQDLSPVSLKRLHRETGGVLVELNSHQGKMLLSLLNFRSAVEYDLLANASIAKLILDYVKWKIQELKVKLTYRKLLEVQNYVISIDATHGWEWTSNGNQLFLLLPINHDYKEENGMINIISSDNKS